MGIRRRYKLNKVMVSGEAPAKSRRDAHDIILDFIRSRPPLKPVRDTERKASFIDFSFFAGKFIALSIYPVRRRRIASWPR